MRARVQYKVHANRLRHLALRRLALGVPVGDLADAILVGEHEEDHHSLQLSPGGPSTRLAPLE